MIDNYIIFSAVLVVLLVIVILAIHSSLEYWKSVYLSKLDNLNFYTKCITENPDSISKPFFKDRIQFYKAEVNLYKGKIPAWLHKYYKIGEMNEAIDQENSKSVP